MDVNCCGAWYVMKYAIKTMIKAGNGGRIVNMASINGTTGVGSKRRGDF